MLDTLSPEFYFRISKEAGLAHDGKGNDTDCFSEVKIKLGKPLDPEKYEEAHEEVKAMMADQLEIPIEYIECISKEEYDANHEDE